MSKPDELRSLAHLVLLALKIESKKEYANNKSVNPERAPEDYQEGEGACLALCL